MRRSEHDDGDTSDTFTINIEPRTAGGDPVRLPAGDAWVAVSAHYHDGAEVVRPGDQTFLRMQRLDETTETVEYVLPWDPTAGNHALAVFVGVRDEGNRLWFGANFQYESNNVASGDTLVVPLTNQHVNAYRQLEKQGTPMRLEASVWRTVDRLPDGREPGRQRVNVEVRGAELTNLDLKNSALDRGTLSVQLPESLSLLTDGKTHERDVSWIPVDSGSFGNHLWVQGFPDLRKRWTQLADEPWPFPLYVALADRNLGWDGLFFEETPKPAENPLSNPWVGAAVTFLGMATDTIAVMSFLSVERDAVAELYDGQGISFGTQQGEIPPLNESDLVVGSWRKHEQQPQSTVVLHRAPFEFRGTAEPVSGAARGLWQTFRGPAKLELPFEFDPTVTAPETR